MLRKNVYIESKQDQRLDFLAKVNGTQKSKLIRKAIDSFIEDNYDAIEEFSDGILDDWDDCESSCPKKDSNIKSYEDYHKFIDHLDIFGDELVTVLYPFQTEILDSLDKYNKMIFKKPRQIGMSTLVMGYLLHQAIYNDNYQIATVTTKQMMGNELIATIIGLLDKLDPEYKLNGLTWKINKSSITFSNGSRITAYSPNPTALRGLTFNLIFIDDFAFIAPQYLKDWLDIIHPLRTHPHTKLIISSVPNGINAFYAMWADALLPSNPFRAIQINGNVIPERIDPRWKETQINTLGEASFRQEYEGAFIIPDEAEYVDHIVNNDELSRGFGMIHDEVETIKPLMMSEVVQFTKGYWEE